MSMFYSLSNFKNTVEQVQEHNVDSPLVILKDFVYNGDKYDSTKQHNTLKELVKQINKKTNDIFKNDKTSEETLKEYIRLIEPIGQFSSKAFYNCKEDEPIKKLIPIINACYQKAVIHKSQGNVLILKQFTKEYSNFLNKHMTTLEKDATTEQDICNKLNEISTSYKLIYNTIEFGLGKDTVEQNLYQTLLLISRSLSTILQQFDIPNDTTSNDKILTLQLSFSMSTCEGLLKTLITLVSRLSSIISPEVKQLMENNTFKGKCIDLDLYKSFVINLIKICYSHVAVTNCKFLASMTLALFIDAIGSPTLACYQFLYTLFPNLYNKINNLSEVSSIIPYHQLIDFGCSKLIEKCDCESLDFSLLAVARGILTCVRKETLLTAFSTKENSSMTLLKDICLAQIQKFCEKATDPPIRIVSFETLSKWLFIVKELLLLKNNSNGQNDSIKNDNDENGQSQKKRKKNKQKKSSDQPDMEDSSTFTNEKIKKIHKQLQNILTKEFCHHIIEYVFDNWSDPLDVIHYKSEEIFKGILGILSLVKKFNPNNDFSNEVITNIMERLLNLSYNNKSRYGLLALLVSNVGTELCLKMQPDILSKSINMLKINTLARRCVDFVISMFSTQIKEAKAKSSTENIFQKYYIDSIFEGLVSDNDNLRYNITTYLYKELLKNDKTVFNQLIEKLKSTSSVPTIKNENDNESKINEEYRLHAILSLTKITCQILNITDNIVCDDEEETVKFSSITSTTILTHNNKKEKGKIQSKNNNNEKDDITKNARIGCSLLKECFNSSSLDLRIDALGMLCDNAKEFKLPTPCEANLFFSFLTLNGHCDIPEFRHKFESNIKKFLLRIRNGIYSEWRDYHNIKKRKTIENIHRQQLESIEKKVDYYKNWLEKFVNYVTLSLYPDTSYQRGILSLKIISILISVFGITEIPLPAGFCKPSRGMNDLFPFRLPILTERNVKLLLSTLNLPYDSPRQLIFQILMSSDPTKPWEGIETVEIVEEMLKGVIEKLNLPSAKDMEGAVILGRLLSNKYVNQLGWDIKIQESQPTDDNNNNNNNETMTMEIDDIPGESVLVRYIRRIIKMLDKQINIATKNLTLAAQKYPMFGLLALLNCIFSDINYKKIEPKNLNEYRELHKEIIDILYKASNVVLKVLQNAAPEGNIPNGEDDDVDNDNVIMNENENDNNYNNNDDDMAIDTTDNGHLEVGPKYQVILSCCWRVIKSATQLLSTIFNNAPIENYNSTGNNNNNNNNDDDQKNGKEDKKNKKNKKNNKNNNDNNSNEDLPYILTYEQIITGSQYFRSLLESVRHHGAFVSVYPGYTALCELMLRSPHHQYSTLPKNWLDESLEMVKNSTTISVTRRSAGIPMLILAVLNAEVNSKKLLLPYTVNALLEIANKPVEENWNEQSDLPQVHALNILRSIFRESKLGNDVISYVPKVMITTIEGFNSPAWAIRNCSTMMFSTMLNRTLGSKKTKDDFDAVNSITCREFFNHYPELHPYLLKQLNLSKKMLQESKSLHPTLFPILAILSRLQPSILASTSTVSVLNMSSFISAVKYCGQVSIYKVREASGRALVSLISSNELIDLIENIITESWSTKNQNAFHGGLMQVKFLLRGHLKSCGIKIKQEFLEKIIPLLSKKLYLLKKEYNQCNVTRALMLEVLEETFIDLGWLITNEDEDEEKEEESKTEEENENENLISSMKMKCLEFINQIVPFISEELFNEKSSEIDICQWQWSKNSARIILKLLLIDPKNKNNIPTILIKLTHHHIYEVRMIALEWILQMLKIINKRTIEIIAFYKFKKDVFLLPDGYSTIYLYNQLQQLLPGFINLDESHQGCMGLILQILPYLLINEQLKNNEEEKVIMTPVDIKELWFKINNMIQTTRYLSIRIACIPLLGTLTRLIVMSMNDKDKENKKKNIENENNSMTIMNIITKDNKNNNNNNNSKFVTSVLKEWSNQIHNCVQDDSPDPLRFETLKSYIYLGSLLSPQSIHYIQLPKENYTFIMKSLFDLILLLQDDDSNIRIHASSIASRIVLGLNNDLFESKTLELLFKHIHDHYHTLPEYTNSIKTMILGEKDLQKLLDYELNSTKHIFELERSNIYKEELINIHIAALYAKPISSQLNSSIERVKSIVKAFEILVNKNDKSLQIIQEFTSRPDIFTIFYRSILWMSLCIRNIKSINDTTKLEIKKIYQQLEPVIPFMNPVLQDICQGIEPWSLLSSLQAQRILSNDNIKTTNFGGLFLTSNY
ncbi:hypothetical protein BCR32DRAFT_263817 [Anaeromyces robustus]|uniref:Uncharacterized protein n=1 Tax=Anaeromyces robustus TaxID=1754192 RepID=A0A1Y1XQV1_9FUNG|nr:hypothetical protein BCR32DRAFT_263817 [Anaeromyces robustus]|eukprot:ORX88141.1 hypothetical protein BCR32DRAFT_263817 [Anaeromyces robustus]